MPVCRLSGEPMKAVVAEVLPYNCVLKHGGTMKADEYTVEFLSLVPLKSSVCSRFSGEKATPHQSRCDIHSESWWRWPGAWPFSLLSLVQEDSAP